MSKNNMYVLITGGTSGIGLATSKYLSINGLKTILIGRNKGKNLLNIKSNNCLIYQCDVSDEKQVKNLYQKLKQNKIKLSGIVTCAGISTSESVKNNAIKGFVSDISVNLVGTLYTIIYGLPILVPNSSIVTISSVRALGGSPSGLGYAASKAGVISLTKSLAVQLAEKRIRVNCIIPGAVYPTGMSKKWTKDKISRIKSDIPLKKITKPEDISKAIHFLLSDNSSQITGETINISGGEYM